MIHSLSLSPFPLRSAFLRIKSNGAVFLCLFARKHLASSNHLLLLLSLHLFLFHLHVFHHFQMETGWTGFSHHGRLPCRKRRSFRQPSNRRGFKKDGDRSGDVELTTCCIFYICISTCDRTSVLQRFRSPISPSGFACHQNSRCQDHKVRKRDTGPTKAKRHQSHEIHAYAKVT